METSSASNERVADMPGAMDTFITGAIKTSSGTEKAALGCTPVPVRDHEFGKFPWIRAYPWWIKFLPSRILQEGSVRATALETPPTRVAVLGVPQAATIACG
jgi:hypothetical protein